MPTTKTPSKPVKKSSAKAAAKAPAKPAAKTAPKTAAPAPAKPKTTAKPSVKPVAKPLVKPAAKPVIKAVPKSKAVLAHKGAAEGSAAKKASAKPKSVPLHVLIAQSLDDDKAEDIVSYDLIGQTSLTDHMIIASGKSARQVSAMAEHLRDKLEKQGKRPLIEGIDQGDWVLVDVGDVIVHLFRPEVRAFYQLEALWGPVAK